MNLSKFDAAERQLNQAIHLFFNGGDVVSVHTFAEAAAQILFDLRKQFGSKSLFRNSERIRKEYMKEWNDSLARSRNFFKHADRDPHDVHEFKEEFNHFSILDATNLLLSAKKSWTPETIVFFSWFSANYPSALEPDPQLSAIASRLTSIASPLSQPEQRDLFARGLADLRSGTRPLPGISLELGLPK